MAQPPKGIKKLVERSKAAASAEPKPIEQFFRVKNVTEKTDHFPAFQVEMLTVQGNRILKREPVTKRDLKGQAMGAIEEFVEHGYHPVER